MNKTIKLNNGVEMPLAGSCGLIDTANAYVNFALTDEEMSSNAALDKSTRYYASTPEMLKKYAEMDLPVDEQK